MIAAQALHVAVDFRIPDLLAAGPKSSVQLAAACGAHAPTLERLLHALTNINVFQRGADGLFRNSPMSEMLRRDHPQTLWAEAMYLPAPYVWKVVGDLSESVRTGESAFTRVHGQTFYEYLAHHPDDAAAFDRVMTQEIVWTTPAVLKAYDFSRFRQIVDVGGGQGMFLRALLLATPGLFGVLFDLPGVVAEAGALLRDVDGRSRIVAGNFLDSVPAGGDAYMLKKVLANWSDTDAVKILSSVRRAIPPDGTLLLLEHLADSSAHPIGLTDLVMLLIFGGRGRSESDFRSLVQSAGFSLSRIVPAGNYSLIECRPT